MSLGELLMLNEQLLVWICGEKCPEVAAKTRRGAVCSVTSSCCGNGNSMSQSRIWFPIVGKPKYAESAMGFVSESIELTEMFTSYMEGIRVE